MLSVMTGSLKMQPPAAPELTAGRHCGRAALRQGQPGARGGPQRAQAPPLVCWMVIAALVGPKLGTASAVSTRTSSAFSPTLCILLLQVTLV